MVLEGLGAGFFHGYGCFVVKFGSGFSNVLTVVVCVFSVFHTWFFSGFKLQSEVAIEGVV